MAIEIEVKLSIQDAFADEVVQSIRDWQARDDIALKFVRERSHTDLYFDTSSKTLFSRGIYLRLRYHANSQLKEITYRALTPIGFRLMQLTEINENVSKDVLARAITEVEKLTNTPHPKEELSSDDALSILSSYGLKEILNVQTARSVSVLQGPQGNVGLVMVDRSIFHIDEVLMPYSEIEIRGMEDHSSLLDSVVARLLNEFPGIVQLTTMSKLERALHRYSTMVN